MSSSKTRETLKGVADEERIYLMDEDNKQVAVIAYGDDKHTASTQEEGLALAAFFIATPEMAELLGRWLVEEPNESLKTATQALLNRAFSLEPK